MAIEDSRGAQHAFVKNQLDVAATVRIEGYVNQSVLGALLVEDPWAKCSRWPAPSS